MTDAIDGYKVQRYFKKEKFDPNTAFSPQN